MPPFDNDPRSDEEIKQVVYDRLEDDRLEIQIVSMTRSQGMPTRSLACFTDARDEESKRHRTSSSRGK